MCPKYSIVENDGVLMLMALHTHFLPQQQYSRVYTLFLASSLWLIDEDASFFLKLTVLFFFQNSVEKKTLDGGPNN